MLWHHVFGVMAILLCMVGGYATVGIISLSMLVEVSSLILNFRILIAKEDYGKPMAQALMLLFFITYTVFRVINLPLALYLCLKLGWFTMYKVGWIRKICYVIAFLQFFVLVCLNYYWYF